MVRIPIPDRLEPRAISGDRLTQMGGEGFSAPGRALAGLGSQLTQLAQDFKNDNDKIEGYNANLALERWSNDQNVAYQTELEGSSPDGADFIPKRQKNLETSFQAVRKGIVNPELKAKADLVFERLRGSQVLAGMGDVKTRRKAYVKTTTDLGVERAVNTDQIQTEEQFNDYFETVVKPKIDTFISDPVEREALYSEFGSKLGKAYLNKTPNRALPKKGSLVSGLGEAIDTASQKHGVSSEYLARVAMVESGGGRNLSNPNSSARGPFQFIKSTAKDYGLRNPMDFGQSAEAAARLTKDNRDYLRQRLQREPTMGELYLAHQQGGQGAVVMLLNPNAVASSLVGAEAVRLNGGNPGTMTAGEFASKWTSKFEGGSIQVTDIPAVKPTTGMWTYVGDDEWQQASKEGQAAVRTQQADEERAKKEVEEEVIKSGHDLIVDDKLTEEWIEQNKDSLSAAQYGSFQKAFESQERGGDTDSAMYLHLYERAMKDPEQNAVRDDAVQMFGDKQLNKSDFNRIMGLSKATERAQTKPWVSEIRGTLSKRLAPLDRDDIDQYNRRLDGLFALDDWMEKNPNAGRDEVKKKANEIAKEYSEGIDLRGGLDMPQNTTVGRYNMNRAAIGVAAQKLQEGYKAGRVSQEALHREVEILKKWMSVIEEEERNGQP